MVIYNEREFVNVTSYKTWNDEVWSATVKLVGKEYLLTSFNNPSYPHSLGVVDVGGPFHVKKQSFEHSSFNGSIDGDGAWEFQGTIFAQQPTASEFPNPTVSSNEDLWEFGTTAIANSLPTNPVAEVSTALGEIYRDGVPDIVGSGLLRNKVAWYRSLGSEYLNVEFGWKPFLSDLRKFAHAVKNSKTILDKYEKNSGKNYRVSYGLPADVSQETYDFGASAPWSNPSLDYRFFVGSGLGTKQRLTTTSRRKWFEGCFTYYLNTGKSAGDRMARASQEANKLFGHRITPEVLWNLAPWSWAADWMSNMGDVLHNVSAFLNDGLVMRYGYVMEQTSITKTYIVTGVTPNGGGPGSFTATFRTDVKARVKGTPFGFGLDIEGFTPRQWAITAALGLSQGGNKLAY